MAVTQKNKLDNYSKYYFIHTIKGVNKLVLGDNLINVYIDKNRAKYNLYIECSDEVQILENHSDLKSAISGNDENILYVFEVGSKYRKNYNYFRNNEVENFDSWFVDEITKLSGYQHNKRGNDGKLRTETAIAQLEPEGIISFVMWKLYDIYQLDLYDDFMDVPDVSPDSSIRNWKDYMVVFTEVREGKKDKGIIMQIVNEDFKAVRIEEEEFIENY